jgi:predicted nucleic acid-binding protein
MGNYVIDTNAIINYHNDIFNENDNLSRNARNIIDRGFSNSSDVRLSIPSIVFVEIFKKKFVNDEIAKTFLEIYKVIKESPNIEIKSIDREVLEKFILIDHNYVSENHDKIILASAMMLSCPLISYDTKIVQYVKNTGIIPAIIS